MGTSDKTPTRRSDGLWSPPHIIEGSSVDLERYQSERPLGSQESARIWQHSALGGVEVFRGSYKTYQAAHHYHTVAAIGIVAQGAMTSYCRGATHVLAPKTVFLINPEEVHAPGPAIPDGWLLRAFYFDESFFRARSSNFGSHALRFSQVFVQDAALANSLLRLHGELEGGSTALELEAALLSVFGRVAENYVCGASQLPAPKRETARVSRVKDYLHASYGRNITLDDLADVAHFSPYHLLRTFRSAVGLTPQAYLTQIRVEEAKRLLRLGRPISDVAAETGFADQAHLNRHFKRITGVTPGQYLPRPRVRSYVG